MSDSNPGTDPRPAVSSAEAAALIGLAALDGVGPAALRCAADLGVEAVVSAVRADRPTAVVPFAERLGTAGWRSAVNALLSQDLDARLDEHLCDGRRVLVAGRRGYPSRLDEEDDPPPVLFLAGDPVQLEHHSLVAIVGTRNATKLGMEFAEELGADLDRAGVAVVSGLALGIDGAAHRGALERSSQEPGGPPPVGPVGVVAAGLDVVYPPRHRRLHAEVARTGVLVSETPLGLRPTRWRFPARNRIIAALADAVVVVESRSRGGSMLTAEEALLRDRPIFAVPGHPYTATAAGTNDLLADGARPLRDASDVLGYLALAGHPVSVAERPQQPGVERAVTSPLEASVLSALARGPASLSEIVLATAGLVDEVATALVRLEADGRVDGTGGWFQLARSGLCAWNGGTER